MVSQLSSVMIGYTLICIIIITLLSMKSKEAHMRYKTLRALQRSKKKTSATYRRKGQDAASSLLYHQGGRDPCSRSALQRIDRCSRPANGATGALLFRSLLWFHLRETMDLPFV
jgi:hypothetical protein